MSVPTTPTRHDQYCEILLPWVAVCDCGVAEREQAERDKFKPHARDCQARRFGIKRCNCGHPASPRNTPAQANKDTLPGVPAAPVQRASTLRADFDPYGKDASRSTSGKDNRFRLVKGPEGGIARVDCVTDDEGRDPLGVRLSGPSPI